MLDETSFEAHKFSDFPSWSTGKIIYAQILSINNETIYNELSVYFFYFYGKDPERLDFAKMGQLYINPDAVLNLFPTCPDVDVKEVFPYISSSQLERRRSSTRWNELLDVKVDNEDISH